MVPFERVTEQAALQHKFTGHLLALLCVLIVKRCVEFVGLHLEAKPDQVVL